MAQLSRRALLTMPALAAALMALAPLAGAGLDNPFFAFDNGAGRGELTLETQAQLLKETGYAGIGYSGTREIPRMLEALDRLGLKLGSIYVRPDEPGLEEAMAQLKGRDTLILLYLTKDTAGDDKRAVAVVQKVADLAASSGLKVALYPHYGFYVATVADALRVAEASGRNNVGISFNLCHWLKEGDEARLPERLKQALPRLYMVSINGAEHEGDWDRLIQTLDRGDFDVYGLLSQLTALRYRGPVALQCYNVKGDRRENLARSVAVWRKFAVRMAAGGPVPLPGTAPLTEDGDFAWRMVGGINRYLDRQTAAAIARPVGEPSRDRLRVIVGAVDKRVAPRMEIEAADPARPWVAEGPGYRVYAARWSVLDGVSAEGLLYEPAATPVARVVAIPDADTPPESDSLARRLAENGCQVLAPTLVDRRDTWSGIPGLRMTNQPHREWIYRQAFEVGRHIIGYEVQRVLAAVDWLANRPGKAPIAVAGQGEGGLLALFSAALDDRIERAMVAGYFQARREIWREPIYRDLWGYSRDFSDAELARLVAPRRLVVAAVPAQEVSGPPPVTKERSTATPNGVIHNPSADLVREEVERARPFFPAGAIEFSGDLETALGKLLGAAPKPAGAPQDLLPGFDPAARSRRQFDELVAHVQSLVKQSPQRRVEFWSIADSSTPERWRATTRFYRDYVWDEVIGRMPPPSLPPNAQTRLVYDEPKFRGYEVRLDVWPDVFAYGLLLVPKDIKSGERRPVVVCQHGLEGRPVDVADPNFESPYYHRYAVRLAEEGFVTFAPQNPYIGEDRFRIIQRKGHPLKLALFSFILGQHQRILEWLGAQPFVDASRIGFYGLSYGGKTAVRVPPLLDGYALSICSADYNEWVWKTTSVDARYSYMTTGEYDMYEFNFANTANYAELATLMAPRPFMVERGHLDGVAPDEWVAYEYAKVRYFYDTKMNLPDATTIEFFNGPHSIHAQGTVEFLRKHLRWPQ